MGQALSALLGPAVGIAVSPFPIVGLILILLSKNKRINSIFYSLGWLIGNALLFLLAFFLLGSVSAGSGGPSTVGKIVYIVLAVLLLLLAVKEFLGRPKRGEQVKTPGWMNKMSNIKPLGAAGFSFLLSALNPKNALLSITAGVSVGAVSGLTTGNVIVATVVFLLISGASILLPTIVLMFTGTRLDHSLDQMREWLITNNAVIMSVLLLFIALSLVNKAF